MQRPINIKNPLFGLYVLDSSWLRNHFLYFSISWHQKRHHYERNFIKLLLWSFLHLIYCKKHTCSLPADLLKNTLVRFTLLHLLLTLMKIMGKTKKDSKRTLREKTEKCDLGLACLASPRNLAIRCVLCYYKEHAALVLSYPYHTYVYTLYT